MYGDETIPIRMKKNIVNCLLGCVDKWDVSKRYCEWHDSEMDANSMLGINPNGKRIEISLKRHETVVPNAFFEGAIDDVAYLSQHEVYQNSQIQSMFVNAVSSVDHRFSEGFLPISVLKYQLQRLRVLKSWQMVERSKTLEPVGVKVDNVFVRRRK